MWVSVHDHRCISPESIHRRRITCNESTMRSSRYVLSNHKFVPTAEHTMSALGSLYFDHRIKKDTCLFASNEKLVVFRVASSRLLNIMSQSTAGGRSASFEILMRRCTSWIHNPYVTEVSIPELRMRTCGNNKLCIVHDECHRE